MIQDLHNSAEAERCLLTAIDVARRQGARLFELRPTVSLARLLRDLNRRDEARTMLLKSTAGSPRVSIPPTCRTPRHWSMS